MIFLVEGGGVVYVVFLFGIFFPPSFLKKVL